MQYKKIQRRFEFLDTVTPDVVAEQVRALLTLPDVRVEKLVITAAGKDSTNACIVADLYEPNVEPPEGVVPEAASTDIWQTLSQIEMETVILSNKFNLKAIQIVMSMLVKAAKDRRAPVGWAVGRLALFMQWFGLKGKKPSTFLGAPLIESKAVGEDRLVLLCARSVKQGAIGAKWGYVALLDGEEQQSINKKEEKNEHNI
ncbi:MAG: hypothetical protein ACXAEU_23825 [Candidatus Hodarchaeales archaeon]|jgi:hypothetical protein